MSNNNNISSLDELFYRAKEYRTSDNFRQMLSFINQLPIIAPFNAMLIWEQNPDVTYVATAQEWKLRFGRTIKPKARSYVILKAFGPVDFVYDVKDTQGDPLPTDISAYYRAEGTFNTQIWKFLTENCASNKINLKHDNTLRLRQAGWASNTCSYNYNSYQIGLNSDHSPTVQFATLVHELAHILLGHLGGELSIQKNRPNFSDKRICEIEAEAVSWLVCQRVGIQTDADRYLFNYLENQDMPDQVSLDLILTVAGKIEAMGRSRVNLYSKKK